MTDPRPVPDNAPWYSGITRYQWTVLVIASLGWVFDIFEGQIFVASMNEAMPSLMERLEGESDAEFDGRKRSYDNWALASFLVGGAVGGIVFGMLSDRIGRKKTMTLTILFYSLFTCVSALSMQWWHLAALRFLVAMGVGGEWAVASSLVFEEFPRRARAHVGGIFHASSVLGTYLAVAAASLFIANQAMGERVEQWAYSLGVESPALAASFKWRIGFALGVLPAVLIIWIRSSLKEPESWEQARQRAAEDSTQQVGRFGELFSPGLLRNTLVGFILAAVGMATFWGVHIYGKDVMRNQVERELTAAEGTPNSASNQPELQATRQATLKRWEMIGMFLVTTGGGLGLILFGPVSQRIGRRPAFLAYHLGGMAMAGVLFGLPLLTGAEFSRTLLYVLLPVFGFLTLGMHAGYAIYFPELYPTRLRGTGTGFCFNAGRIAAAPILILSGWLLRGFESEWLSIAPIGLAKSCLLLSLLYLVGVLALAAAPETRWMEDAEPGA